MSWLSTILLLSCAAASLQYKVASPYRHYLKEDAPVAAARHHDGQHNKFSKFMIGEQFFKDNEDPGFNAGEDDQLESVPYTVLQTYNTFEKRLYPAHKCVCNKTHLDTAADPLAGLERMNPFEIMSSRRWQKSPTSQMFKELFKYIQGVNQAQEEVEMTTPVIVSHKITKETTLGDYEEVEMCFYLPSKYQEEHEHAAEARHVAETAPPPLANGKVYIKTFPSTTVFVRRFGGFPFTHEQWAEEREALENDLIGHRHKTDHYMTASYDSPWTLTNRRNEVMVVSLEEDVQGLEDDKKAGGKSKRGKSY